MFSLLELTNSLLDQVQGYYFSHPRTLFAIVILLIYLLCYLHNAVQKPLLFSVDGRFSWFLKANCPTIGEYYWPTFWCYETHLLTPIATFLRGLQPRLPYHREYVRTFDGGQIALDWYDPNSAGSICDGQKCTSAVHRAYNQPIVLFLPGMSGDSQAEYIKTMVPIAHSVGYRVVTLVYRGLGKTPLTTPRLYCAANHEDLEHALRHIRASNPHSKLIAVGISMGGILIGRYLISSGYEALVDATFLISVVWNFHEVADNMERGLNYPLTKLLTNALIGIVLEHRHWFEGVVDLAAVQRARSIREFDEAFTIRMFGFPSSKDYYTEASHKGKIAAIKKPTFCINAADDPFAPFPSLPLDEVQESSHVAMLVTARGGHIGFMEGILPRLFRPPFPGYSERILEQYLKALWTLNDLKLLN